MIDLNDPEGYYCNFAGLENINIENIPEKNTDDYITYVVHLLGECFESKNMSLLEPYIDENINFFHFMKNIKIKTKYELLKYFNQTFEKIFNADYKSYMIEFVGNWFKIKTSSLMLASDEILKNANVTLPQPSGSLGLIIERFLNNKKDVVAITIQFNENKLINDIYFGDPYAMKFKDSNK